MRSKYNTALIINSTFAIESPARHADMMQETEEFSSKTDVCVDSYLVKFQTADGGTVVFDHRGYEYTFDKFFIHKYYKSHVNLKDNITSAKKS